MENLTLLLKLDNLIEGTIIKRPSKIIKSPYVADISTENNEPILGHCASLGCCGLADNGATILMAPPSTKKNDEDKIKCTFHVYLSVNFERNQKQIIGIHPKLAEKLVHSALIKNCFTSLQNIQKLKPETKIHIPDFVDSRFDFTGIDNEGKEFILEVKNVPLADYEDITAKERKNKNYDLYEYNSKIAYFPDGYRKKAKDTISPRALKHITELTYLKQNKDTRCIMCYVIQRTDVSSFQPSFIDPIYREAFKEAYQAGVEIMTLVVSWTPEGEAYFVSNNLPINFPV